MSNASRATHSVETILEERVRVNDGLIYVSGLSAADVGGGIPPVAAVSPEYPYYGADIQKQSTYVLEKLTALLETHGAGLQDVVKTQVFLTDCRLFDAFDQVWKRFFPVPPPRTTVGVGGDALAVPGTLVVVDVIAAQSDKVAVTHVESPRLAKPLANYTPCVAAGDWLFLAGQLPTDFGVTGLASDASVNPHFPYHVAPLIAQAEYTIGICHTLLEDAGSDWDHAVRVHVFLKHVDQAPLFQRLWNDHFKGSAPPCVIIGVEELLTGGAEIEIDVIAVRAGTALHHTTADEGGGCVVAVSGTATTVFAMAELDIDATSYRPFAVEQATSDALERAAGMVHGAVEPVKVHAFLPHNTDIWGFGRGLSMAVSDAAAITTSPSVSASRISLEIVYRAGASA